MQAFFTESLKTVLYHGLQYTSVSNAMQVLVLTNRELSIGRHGNVEQENCYRKLASSILL